MHSEKTTIGLRAERIAVRAALIMGLALATTTLAGRPAMAQEGQSALGMIVDEQDWEIGCDNLRACVALGMNPVEGQAGDYLRVTRDGDPNAAPVIELVIPAPDDDAAKPKQPFAVLALDAAGEGSLPAGPLALTLENDSYRYRFADEAVEELLAALPTAKSMTVDLHDGDNALSSGVVSLAGAAAALIQMDEVQQRSGTVTALIRRGTASADTIPMPPEVMTVKSLPIGELQDPLPKPPEGATAPEAQCADSVPPRVAYDLGQGSMLWGACATVDDNNVDYVFQMFAGEKDQNVAFLLPGEPGDDATRLYNPYIDEETRRLGSFYKQNETGDCGSATDWAFNGETFAPTLYISMGACRGVMPVDWPVLYRAEVE
ncbi:MAG: DUF1176 domain-containing protein [Bosea sp.]|nr:DUF1176 domain-containing protein [Bosea sp. (in: a-proteobacteria)]